MDQGYYQYEVQLYKNTQMVLGENLIYTREELACGEITSC